MEKNCLVSGTLLKGAAYTYKIERVLGQGSFGITYLATTDVTLEGALGTFSSRLRVAVKEFFMRDINGRHDQTVTCGTQGGLYEHYRHKFAREAQNLSKLHHPHIVRVLEAFEANNTVYYAMEFCEEGSLDELIAVQGGLSEAVALTFARQIGSALDYMHGERVLHLDLKPGNVMLRGKDEATLIDFGLSKQYDETGEPESSTTIGGGTPGYAPLEQSNYREGREFPVQMDLYALGATLFKMLTGERPAEAAVLLNEGFPTEKLTAKGVSEQTIAVVEKAMSPMKRDRYGSVAEFLAALDGVANEQPSAPAPEERTVYTDPAVEATVVDEEPQQPTPQPTPAPKPTPQPAPQSAAVKENPITPTPKKKGSKKWLWTVLILLLVAGGFWGGRTAMTHLREQQTIADSIALAEAERAAFVQDSTEKANAATEKAEKERLAAEKAERERLAAEQAAKEKAEKERREREAREAAEKETEERFAPMVNAGKGRDGVYRVGDYYNVNGKEGVVFYVDASGRYGKIVSMTQSSERLQWSSNDSEQKRLIGASSKTNGAANMQAVRQRPNWRADYPAFAWCARLGAGWYLPAIEELELFTTNDSVHDAVNRTLAAKGGTRLYNLGDSDKWYWSSTEYDYKAADGDFCAWYVGMYGGYTYNNGSKYYDIYVRAVSAF
ncbi:MAG: protein kinase [Alistipes sp.]|nr:protein kinase [Alistipes sp.]